MRIAVWCASSPGADPRYLEAAALLGAEIARRSHELVFGGSKCGLMGAVADACLAAGGRVTGVTVDVPHITAQRHPALTTCEETPDLGARKARMIALADAFVALPGSSGTLDEIGDVLSMLKAGVSDKPIAMVNVGGFYEPLRALIDNMVGAGFSAPRDFARVHIAPTVAAALTFIGA